MVLRVAAAVIKGDDGRIFCTRRGYGPWKDFWEFPGGKIEQNESPEEALKREITEELATDIRVDSFLVTAEYDYPGFHLSMDCFLCTVISGELTLLEAEDSKWLAVEDLEGLDWLPADIIAVEKLKEEFRKNC